MILPVLFFVAFSCFQPSPGSFLVFHFRPPLFPRVAEPLTHPRGVARSTPALLRQLLEVLQESGQEARGERFASALARVEGTRGEGSRWGFL